MSKCFQAAAGVLALAAIMLRGAGAEAITLEQAIARALIVDPRIEERRHLVDVARGQLGEVEGNAGLRMDLNTFLGIAPALEGGLFEEGSCTSPQGCIVRSDRYDLGRGISPWVYLQISVVKPLYTFGKLESYSTAARANIEVKQGDVRLQRAQTVVDVSRAYYGYLAARDGRIFLEDVQRRAQGAVELVQRWLDEGTGEVTQSDLYALQSGAALVARYLAQARGLERVSLEGLKVLTGAGPGAALEPADARLAPVEAPAQALQALQDEAMARRPEMRQLEHGLTARRALIAAEKALAKPNVYVGVGGTFSYSPRREQLDNPYITDIFNDRGVSPMIGMQWNWVPGAQAARANQAKAEYDALVSKSALARVGIPFQVAEQYALVESNREAVARLEEASRAARRWMISAYTDFEAGLTEAQKIVTAFQGYVLAHTEYLRTLYDYNMNVVQLQNAIGAYE